jgi:hypothetical protein
MQLTSALCALILAVSVSAVALPNAQPIAAAVAAPQCGRRGQPCGKAKHEPAADALAQCGRRGQPCGKVKRAAEAFADALAEASAEPHDDSLAARHARRLTRDLASIVAETQDDPEAYYDNLSLTEEDDEDISKRDASAEPEAQCGRRGQPCGKAKRDASPKAGNSNCGRRGQPCGKLRRAAEAIAEAVSEPEPEAQCGRRGQPCGKAKRDAHAMAYAAEIALTAL